VCLLPMLPMVNILNADETANGSGRSQTSDSRQSTKSEAEAKKIIIVCDGSSWVQGSNHPGFDWPKQLGDLFRARYHTVNLGVNGQPTTAIIADYKSQVAPLYNGNHAGNVYIAWEIYNHVAGNGHNVNEAMSRWWELCDMAKATGYTVIPPTLPPLASLPPKVTEACNAIMRAKWRKHVDVIADIAILPEMVDCPNETYRDPDHVHWTAAGNAVIAAKMRGSLLALWSKQRQQGDAKSGVSAVAAREREATPAVVNPPIASPLRPTIRLSDG
jgi:hypothetical protein